MIKRQHVKSCCGGKAYIFEASHPIAKSHLPIFKNAGYISPDHYEKVGVFYVELKGLIATAPFGSTRIQVKCSSGICRQLMDSFANLLDQTLLHG